MDRFVLLIVCVLFGAATAISMHSQESPPALRQDVSIIAPVAPAPNVEIAASAPQSVSLSGSDFSYRAFIKETRITDLQQEFPPADVVSFSYELDGDAAYAMRPVVFFFNGGPGSASIWLHMTGFGPEKVSADLNTASHQDVTVTSAPNAGFLIDVADLVFVDPVGTGLSRVAEGGDERAFQDIRADALSMCRFVQEWLKAEDRLGAPIYIVGVSYGTLRAAGMASHPRCREFRRNLDGLVFVSGLLDLRMRHTNDSAGRMSLYPTLAATAWHRGLVDEAEWDGDFDRYLTAMEDYAETVLGPALANDFLLPREKHRAIMEELTAQLGIAPPPANANTLFAAIQSARYRVDGAKSACIYDARFNCRRTTGAHPELPLSKFGQDLEAKLAAQLYLNMNHVLDTNAYKVLRGNRFRSGWDFRFNKSHDSGSGTDMALNLVRSLRPDRPIKIMVASGIYDLATPYHAMEVALRRAGLKPEQFDLHLYQGGHMMYLQKETGHQLAADIRSFILRDAGGS